jgi:predicted ABC-type transport system involved in lysophospholipase L1 biosynthesis ATPase subunit
MGLVIVTHEASLAQRAQSRVALCDGRIVADASAGDVRGAASRWP